MNHYEDGTDNMRKEEEGNKTDTILLQKDREEWEKCKRQYFELCYYGDVLSNFKGQIEKESKGMICFKRIFVSGIYSDGLGFEGREDHVWMKNKGFEQGGVGDGKAIDFALRNPRDITQISDYELPSDDELHMQSIDRIICEVCMYNEHCYNGICIAEEWWDEMRRNLFMLHKENSENEKESGN